MSCAICETRKEKRFCPAVHGRICPQCCGEQREVTLDCPSDCPYLQQAREHERPRSAGEFDAASLFLQIEISEQFTYEREHLLMGLTYALAKAAHADPSLNDRDLIAALSAMCTSYERLVNSGLHYEQPLTGGGQHAVAAQVEEMVKEYAAGHEGEIPRPERWKGYVLRPERVEFWINRENRLHDRFLFVRGDVGWVKSRLFP